MSTRLHHAVELKLADHNLGTLETWAQRLRPKMVALAYSVQARWVIREAVKRYDRATLDGRLISGENCLREAWREGREELKEAREGRRRPDLDVTASIQVMVDRDTQSLHALFFMENPEMIRFFMSQPEVSAAPYYDGDDTLPKGMTLRGWKVRKRLWDRLLPDGIPCHSGVNVTLVDDWHPYLMPGLTEAREYWPTLPERARALGGVQVSEELLLALRAGGESPDERRWMHLLCGEFDDRVFRAWIEERTQNELGDTLAPEAWFPDMMG